MTQSIEGIETFRVVEEPEWAVLSRKVMENTHRAIASVVITPYNAEDGSVAAIENKHGDLRLPRKKLAQLSRREIASSIGSDLSIPVVGLAAENTDLLRCTTHERIDQYWGRTGNSAKDPEKTQHNMYVYRAFVDSVQPRSNGSSSSLNRGEVIVSPVEEIVGSLEDQIERLSSMDQVELLAKYDIFDKFRAFDGLLNCIEALEVEDKLTAA